jgi:predicted acylesterase/phospholipase RssA
MANPSPDPPNDDDGADDSLPGRPFRVLALHGGGVHGVATAAFLADIEGRTDRPIRQYFDLITGTSTGALIALSLSRDIPAADITRFYAERAPALFDRRLPFLPKLGAQLFTPLYRSVSLYSELRDVLGEDARLGDAKCRLCIPATNISSGKAVVFKTRHHEDFERDHILKMWRVAAATAAAPMYFRPAKIPGRGWFVDGGLWANAPIEVGVAEGLKLGYALDEIDVLSIGTGNRAYHKDGAPHKFLGAMRHGLVGWGSDLMRLTMRTQTQRARNLTSYLLPERRLTHVDFQLPEGVGGLDAVRDVDTLANRARAVAKCEGKTIRETFFAAPAPSFTPIP